LSPIVAFEPRGLGQDPRNDRKFGSAACRSIALFGKIPNKSVVLNTYGLTDRHQSVVF
jgi:hypothetical protein